MSVEGSDAATSTSPPMSASGSPHDDLALERARDDVDGDRHATEALDAGLVQVALGKHTLAHQSGGTARGVDDR